MNKKFDFIDRLVAFAGDVILFLEAMPEGKAVTYLFNQLMRSSGSAALKDLRESQVNFQIMNHIDYGNEETRSVLEQENVELVKSFVTMIKNRQARA